MRTPVVPDITWQASRHHRLNQQRLDSLAAAKGPRRYPADVLATVAWCEKVKNLFNVFTAHQVEVLLARKNGRLAVDVTKKWNKYETGCHTPSKQVVYEVEALHPGTARLINHPLWQVLRMQPIDQDMIHEWLREFSPAVQQICFDRKLNRVAIGKRRLRQLERQGSLDSLACLTALLREALWLDDQDSTWLIAESLFRMLLMTLCRCELFPIAEGMWSLYRDELFCKVRCKGLTYKLDDFDPFDYSHQLVGLMLAFEDIGVFHGIGEKEEACEMQAIMDGTYGFVPIFLFASPIGPTEPRTQENEKAYLEWERNKRIRDWAQQEKNQGRLKTFPPAEMFQLRTNGA
ncbi:hypothetical protein LH425_14820 [Laribacter hongkongensis]|uniref:hypothetical protein n=1 Tax=Laribacter hongkongensis TaxID=168471 RepID=UPI001EFEB8E0|nr:hypothetical protein [Laribacter hongkongensis]MCG9066266.1 hypothetical protein [Laribacter hongkongensis]